MTFVLSDGRQDPDSAGLRPADRREAHPGSDYSGKEPPVDDCTVSVQTLGWVFGIKTESTARQNIPVNLP